MTESQFWSWIKNALRSRSMYWKPIQEAKKLARRLNQSQNKRLKYEYRCAKCEEWFPDKNVEVDHITPCGTFNKESLGEWVERCFCETEGFQVLCKGCHKTKTAQDIVDL